MQSVRELTALAGDLGTTMPRLAIAWCLKNPNVSTVIMGASKKSQLEDNLKSLEVADKITPTVAEQIEDVLGNKPEPMEFQ